MYLEHRQCLYNEIEIKLFQRDLIDTCVSANLEVHKYSTRSNTIIKEKY